MNILSWVRMADEVASGQGGQEGQEDHGIKRKYDVFFGIQSSMSSGRTSRIAAMGSEE